MTQSQKVSDIEIITTALQTYSKLAETLGDPTLKQRALELSSVFRSVTEEEAKLATNSSLQDYPSLAFRRQLLLIEEAWKHITTNRKANHATQSD
jgi:hypothetical protein